jgi:hypothetical protein
VRVFSSASVTELYTRFAVNSTGTTFYVGATSTTVLFAEFVTKRLPN